ncbi:RyR and IP3R homology associated-domain-containing protein [Blyttiomyces helicus]|uniref:RyR and IP3R homology associated-domain-containing protein n=1 Tax=Blyttiomyces helicus TaxID=388810 RepID=A0A4P9W363_9FUNG|nr:RyR and IP3R homology associated-domain-containing protein [Blyttiomyces helicus]|eukprot:RKO85775.1 RyR and IP3R homology associated-domain-containing protein [Blyttiomyces helicus]
MHEQIKAAISFLRDTRQLIVYNARKEERQTQRIAHLHDPGHSISSVKQGSGRGTRHSPTTAETASPALSSKGAANPHGRHDSISKGGANHHGRLDSISKGKERPGSSHGRSGSLAHQWRAAGLASYPRSNPMPAAHPLRLATIEDDEFLHSRALSHPQNGPQEYDIVRGVMRLLQLIVEGHNFKLQEYVRVQPDNIKSFDLVKDVVDYLHAIVPIANEDNIAIIVQVFDTLIDLAQGCTANQVSIFNAKVIQPVNTILSGKYAHCSVPKVTELKGHAVLCLLSLLEDDSDRETKIVFTEMSTTLDLDLTLHNLTLVYERSESILDPDGARRRAAEILKTNQASAKNRALANNPEFSKGRKHRRRRARLHDEAREVQQPATSENKAELKKAADVGYLYCMLIMTLFPVLSDEQRSKCLASPAFSWFKMNTGRIEIVREHAVTGEKRLYTVLFPIPEICASNMRKDTKHRFLWAKKRDSPQDKIESFVNASADIIYEIRNQARVSGQKSLRILAKNYQLWWIGAYLITIVMNIFNLYCTVAPEGTQQPGFDKTFSVCSSTLETIRLITGFLHILFWGLSTAEFTIAQLPLLVNRKRLQVQVKEKEQRRKDKLRLWGENIGKDDTEDAEDVEDTSGGSSRFQYNSTELTTRELALGFLFESRALYHGGMVLLSIVGLFFPPAYALHLLDFMYRDEVLQGVIASITLNWNSLSKTVLLGILIVYVYSVVGFVFFRHAFDRNSGLYCDSLFDCFITILSYG